MPDAGEDIRPLAAHALGVALHDLERCADMGGEIGLVDDQQIGTRDARAPFSRNFFAASDIDRLDAEAAARIDAAIAAARADTLPSFAAAIADVYTPRETA